MTDDELIGFPPQVLTFSAHGYERAMTVTVGRVDGEDIDPNHAIRVTVSHGKKHQILLVPNNPHVVSAAIGKLARDLNVVLDRNQSRLKRILGRA